MQLPEVIQTCGNLRMEEAGAWLGEDIMKAYTRLHISSPVTG